MNFKELNLSKKIISAIEKIGYENATPIQEMAIPKILTGKDVIGIAQTGTGKTAAFSLPTINKLIEKGETDKKIKVLILTPTRELAIQIRDNIRLYTENVDYKCSVILGGVNQKSQEVVLKKGVEIVVATPGRLLDLINQGKAKVDNVHTLILDEADTMLDMGFIRDIRNIISKTPKTRQTLLFSATMPDAVKQLATDFMISPLVVKTNVEEVTADKIKQELYFIDKGNKINLLLELLDAKDKPTTLIFTRTKHGANKLEKQLNEFGIKSSVIHGNKTQSNRVKALNDFKLGKVRIMIATDIAARGIDIADLSLVINYDMPEKPELYVHRIGRTARAGKSGKSISLCSSAETNLLKSVEKLIKMKIPVFESKYEMVLNEKEEVRLTRSKGGLKSKPTRSTNFKEDTKPSSKRDSRGPRSKSNDSRSSYSKSSDSRSSYSKSSNSRSSYSKSSDSRSSYSKSSGSRSSYSKSSGSRSSYSKSRGSGSSYSKSNGSKNSYSKTNRRGR